MKILIGYEKFSKEDAGGARISIHTLLKHLFHRNPSVDIDVFQSFPQTLDKPSYVSNIESVQLRPIPILWWVHQIYVRRQWGSALTTKIAPEEYDVAITQGKLGPATVQVCREKNIPSVMFLRSLRVAGFKHFREEDPNSYKKLRSRGDILQYPFVRWNRSEFRKAIQSADVVVANSEFTRKAIKMLFDVDTRIVYPPITIENYQTTYNPDGKITMVNPRSSAKGADIFLNIAENMPNELFLCVGPVSPEAQRERAMGLDNVELWNWCNDMRKAYAQAKLVVVPSRASESFGRIPAEAMCSGIPCVVSNRGGLPYVVGETGKIVSEIESTNAWISAIRDAEENHDSEAQIQRVNEKFSTEVQVGRLEEILEEHI